MAGSALLNNCRFFAASAGTGSFVYSTTAPGSLSPSGAGAVNGAQYTFYAESLDQTEWELSTGTYNSSTNTFARTNVLQSSAGSLARTSFTNPPRVTIVAVDADLGGGAWISSSVAASFPSGGSGTAAIRYKQIGKCVFICITISCTATGNLSSVQVPISGSTAVNAQYLVGREVTRLGQMYWGSIGLTTCAVGTYNNGVAAMNTGDIIILSGSYEAV